MEEQINKAAQKALLKSRFNEWANTQYVAIRDVKVAQKLGDAAMEEQAKEQAKKAETAMEMFSNWLDELDEEDKNNGA
jgi:hypothetical protein